MCSERHMCTAQSYETAWNFFIIIFIYFYYCFPPPTEANEFVGGDARSEPRFNHSLSEPHQRDNTAQK